MTIQDFRDHDWSDTGRVTFRGESCRVVVIDHAIGTAIIEYSGRPVCLPCECISLLDVLPCNKYVVTVYDTITECAMMEV